MTSSHLRLPRPVVLFGAAVVTALLLAATAVPALAHASVEETFPSDGQDVAEAPDEVSWTFNEPVTSTTGALRIFDSAGERVDTGEQTQPAANELTVGLPDDLEAGSYVATYRVTSADGHVIRGAFVFSVGGEAGVDDDTLAAIFSGGGDAVLSVVAGVARAGSYLGVLLAAGALLWSIAVVRGRYRDEERAHAGTWAGWGAVLAVVSTVVAVPIQAMATSGLGPAALASGRVMGETLGSSVGIAAIVRLVGLGALLLALRGATRSSAAGGRGVLLAGASALVALGSFVVDGHTRTVEPGWLLVAGDAIHLLAGAAWFGGLVLLVRFVRARRLDDDPVGAADTVARFSRLALWSLVTVAIAGSAMGWALVRQPRTLTTTDYGWTLIVKVALVAVVVLVAAYNNRRLVPAITAAAVPAGGSDTRAAPADDTDRRARTGRTAWGQLRRTVRFEAAVLVAVLGVTAFLVNLRPAADAAGITGAFDAVVEVEDTDLEVNLVVDPNRVGSNEVHLYVLDRTGRPVSDIEDVTVELTQPERDIGPISREPFVAGPGHWQLNGRDLAVPGEWEITVVLGIDRFTEQRVTVPVVVNP